MITDHLKPLNWTHTETPEGWTHCFDPSGTQRCGVKKTNGKPCLQTRVKDTGRCAVHQRGAADKRGFEHPGVKDGKHSKFLDRLPSRLRQDYGTILNNPELLDLSENAAILDLMVLDLLPRLHTGDLGQLWHDLNDTYNEAESDMRAALRGKDPEALQRFMLNFRQIGDFVRTGRRDYVTRSEILKISDSKRALVKTISDVEYRGENAITMTDFLALLEFLETAFFRANQLESPEERKQAYAESVRKIIQFEDAG